MSRVKLIPKNKKVSGFRIFFGVMWNVLLTRPTRDSSSAFHLSQAEIFVANFQVALSQARASSRAWLTLAGAVPPGTVRRAIPASGASSGSACSSKAGE